MIDIATLTSADIGRWVHNGYIGFAGLRGRVTGYTSTRVMVRYWDPALGALRTRQEPTRPEELEWAEEGR